MNTDRQLILSPTGRQLFKMGENAWQQFTTGDYCVSIEWHTGKVEVCRPIHTPWWKRWWTGQQYVETIEEKVEPCMVIWSKYQVSRGGAFAICLSSASKYADPSGNPTKEAFIECWNALPTLGRNQLDTEVYHLLDVILRHIPDLIRCPPMPPAARRAEAGEPLLEVTTKTEDGRTLKEAVI